MASAPALSDAAFGPPPAHAASRGLPPVAVCATAEAVEYGSGARLGSEGTVRAGGDATWVAAAHEAVVAGGGFGAAAAVAFVGGHAKRGAAAKERGEARGSPKELTRSGDVLLCRAGVDGGEADHGVRAALGLKLPCSSGVLGALAPPPLPPPLPQPLPPPPPPTGRRTGVPLLWSSGADGEGGGCGRGGENPGPSPTSIGSADDELGSCRRRLAGMAGRR